MTIAVHDVDLHILNMRTRMPFKYGIASMTALPHLFVRVEAEVDGRRQPGFASEGLPPKWFTKDPHTTFRADLADMLEVIRHAGALAAARGPAPTVFEWWLGLYREQMRWGAARGFPPLLAGLGASLVERAAIDAFCRAAGQSFATAVRANSLGMRLDALHPELAGPAPADFLPAGPLRSLVARHTVGLADPVTDGDIPAAERLDDGLPQSLEACIRAYGLTHFKIKLSGDVARDIARLRQISVVVASHAGGSGGTGEGYAFTLDGNEHFHDAGAFRETWQALSREPSLAAFWRHLLFVEQPLHREVALSPEADLNAWPDRPPIIIDESDGETTSLPAALAAGYAGTSHKNCKGVFRGLASAALLARHRRERPQTPYVLSGEDLANVGPVALLQDLAAMATLGVEHVERNGHHYFAGLGMYPPDVQEAVLVQHGDLYRRHRPPGGVESAGGAPGRAVAAGVGFPSLAIQEGRIAAGSVVDAPFGTAFLLDTTRFTPLDGWQFDSLGVVE